MPNCSVGRPCGRVCINKQRCCTKPNGIADNPPHCNQTNSSSQGPIPQTTYSTQIPTPQRTSSTQTATTPIQTRSFGTQTDPIRTQTTPNKTRKCETGRPCGNSCINKNRCCSKSNGLVDNPSHCNEKGHSTLPVKPLSVPRTCVKGRPCGKTCIKTTNCCSKENGLASNPSYCDGNGRKRGNEESFQESYSNRYRLVLKPVLIGPDVSGINYNAELDIEFGNRRSRPWDIVMKALSYLRGAVSSQDYDFQQSNILVTIDTNLNRAQIYDLFSTQGKASTWGKENNMWKYGFELDLELDSLSSS